MSIHIPTMTPHALSTKSGCAPGGRATTSCCCSRGQPARVVRAAALHEAASQLVPQLTDLSDAHAAAVSLAVLASQTPDALQPGAAAVTSPPAPYTPGPVEVGWQIWFAAVVSTIPFVIGRAGRALHTCSEDHHDGVAHPHPRLIVAPMLVGLLEALSARPG